MWRKSSATKKSQFDLGGGVKQLADAGYHRIINGYDDRIRNAIAHGQIRFSANGVIYGQYAGAEERPPWEVAEKFDRLWRTCTGLALGLVLFFLRNQHQTMAVMPVYLKWLLTTKTLEHEGIKIQGFNESTIADMGDQLHISLKISPKTRFEALHEVFLVAYQLIKADLIQYSRYVFEVDCGIYPTGLVIVNTQVLSRLVSEDAKLMCLREAIDDPMLLWHDEGPIRSRIQAYREILTAATRQAKHTFYKDLRTENVIGDLTSYLIRSTENKSVAGIMHNRIRLASHRIPVRHCTAL